MTAVHLLGGLGAGGRIVMINRSGALARGVAYGTTSEQHVLNVPAGRMSAIEDDPESFMRFVRRSGLTADGVYILNSAKSHNLNVDTVNLMAMDYGDSAAPNPSGKMGSYAIQAATSTRA